MYNFTLKQSESMMAPGLVNSVAQRQSITYIH